MCSWRRSLLALVMVSALAAAAAAERYPGLGRAATDREVAAWDIDVRPDFRGLPAGSGSVAQGQVVWEAQCASCHGFFGESNQFFSPLVGGTTADDVRTGRVARLKDPAYPSRTTLMKLATLSTLWDYINRAMPWNQPKSLSADEVYALTAFLLHLGHVLPEHFVLSDQNMAEVQARMPNRHGMTLAPSLWPGREFGTSGRPDVRASGCMRNCAGEVTIASQLPDFARNQHGNLAQQSRLVGAQRGADTSRPETAAGTQARPAGDPAQRVDDRSGSGWALAGQYGCTACHGLAQALLGPSFADIGRKHAGKVEYLSARIRSGGVGQWGPVPMPAQPLGEADANTIAAWIAAGALR